MEHYYKTFIGYFDFEGVYQMAINSVKDSGHFVEIGSFTGQSACYLGVEIKNSGKNIKVDCVDLWTANTETKDPTTTIERETGQKIYNIFLHNIAPIKDIINPRMMSSLEAAKTYADESLDFVYIDGDHSLKAVIKDINAWWPKIKPGAILAGHDYRGFNMQNIIHKKFKSFTIDNDSWIVIKNDDLFDFFVTHNLTRKDV